MANMLHADVLIKGTRPLLWHHFGPDAIPLEKLERSGVAGHDPQEWRRTHTATPDGHLYVDASYIFGTIFDGSYYTKRGRSSIQKMVAATLQVLDDLVFVDRWLPEEARNGGEPPRDPTRDVYLDVRGVVNPSNKARNVRYRVAASKGWTMSFALLWDRTIVSRQEMHAAVIDAGRFSGIGDGRKTGFGRFKVERFAVSEVADET